MARSASQGIGSRRPFTLAVASVLLILLVASSCEALREPVAAARNEHRMILSRRLAQLVEPMGAGKTFGVLAGGGGMGGGMGGGLGRSAGGGEGGSATGGGRAGSAAGGPNSQPAVTETTTASATPATLMQVNTGGTTGGRR